jgi:hypothetical protein
MYCAVVPQIPASIETPWQIVLPVAWWCVFVGICGESKQHCASERDQQMPAWLNDHLLSPLHICTKTISQAAF